MSSTPPNEPTRTDRPVPGPKLGKYQLLRQLGQGGMGVVFEAEDTGLRRRVAVKLLAPQFARDDAVKARFLREAHAAAQLNHPNVVAIYDVNDEGRAFLVMELVPGGSVQRLLEVRGRLPWEMAVKIALQAGQGLAVAHAAGMIHRDVKPANLMLTADGSVKVADFGLVKVADAGSLSTSSTILGTPHYMSPEQCKGETLDDRSDVYSLAATLYVMLTGKLLFEAENAYGVLYAHCSSPLPDPRAMVPDLPDGVVTVLQRGLARTRSGRYTNMNAFVADLMRILEETRVKLAPIAPVAPVAILPPAPTLTSVPNIPRRRWPVYFICSITLVLLIVLVIGIWPKGRRVAPPPAEKLPAHVEDVKAQLRSANPLWTGEFRPTIEDGQVVCLTLKGPGLKDIRPLAVLRELKQLHCIAEHSDELNDLIDLSPLKGLPLQRLSIHSSKLYNLLPLRGMNLQELNVAGCPVVSLEPLSGMITLNTLDLSATKIDSKELAHLRGLDYLANLNLGASGVVSLEELRERPRLKHLSLVGSQVIDVEPVAKCPLVYLQCPHYDNVKVDTLAGHPTLEHIRCTEAVAKRLPSLPNLKRINKREISSGGAQ